MSMELSKIYKEVNVILESCVRSVRAFMWRPPGIDNEYFNVYIDVFEEFGVIFPSSSLNLKCCGYSMSPLLFTSK